MWGGLSHAIADGIKLVIQQYLKPYQILNIHWESLEEEQMEKRLNLLYEIIDIKYPMFIEAFKDTCNEYDVSDIFSYICEEDWFDVDWDSNDFLHQIYETLTDKNDDDAAHKFEFVVDEFTEFIRGILSDGTVDLNKIVKPIINPG